MPITTRSASIGRPASTTGPISPASTAHTSVAAAAPHRASRQRRLTPTASTIAMASRSSTATATAAPSAVRTNPIGPARPAAQAEDCAVRTTANRLRSQGLPAASKAAWVPRCRTSESGQVSAR